MSMKRASLCLMLALAAAVCAAPAFANNENLVDRQDTQESSGGGIFSFFKSATGYATGKPDAPGDHGCEPVINAAGNSVRRPGCP